jgi:putative transposase
VAYSDMQFYSEVLCSNMRWLTLQDDKNERIPENGAIHLPDAAWAEARRRAAVVGPLADKDVVTVDLAREAARELGVSERSVYKLVRWWRESGGSVAALAPTRSHGGKGKGRLPETIETIITATITKYYLTRQRITATKLLRILQAECRQAGVRCPSLNTLRKRIRRLDSGETIRRRYGKDAARGLTPINGTFPEVFHPLDIVQIDHTRVDLVIVDTYTRQPIGRPWLTVAIDVYSRCIVGICLTLEPPSAVSVGLCLAHMAIDKRPWLERMGVNADWPMSGKPKIIHVDNGADFRSEALRRGCETHGIRIVYRPPGQPHFGGIVERVIGTLMQMVHTLPGTTFSSVAEKRGYDSELAASLTLAELERWLVLAITGPYHGEVHAGIGEPPSERWRRGMRDSSPQLAVSNPKSFLVDFLPVLRRRIQRQGFVIDHLVYSSNALRPWIAERHQAHRFIIRRDPRDLSRIFVMHPEEEHYIEVPYRAMSHPAITLWEHRRAVERIRQQGRHAVDEASIFRAVRDMRAVAESAMATKKAARRALARQQHLPKPQELQSVAPPQVDRTDFIPPKLFDDIEQW